MSAATPASQRRRIRFRDPAADVAIQRDGFAVLSRGIDRSTISQLTEFYEGVMDLAGRDDSGMFAPTMKIVDPFLRAKLWDGVREITAPWVEPLLDGLTGRLIGGSFVEKPPSELSARNPHQDPTVYDERRFTSISLWIPLADSTLDNGTLRFLPGSHRLGNHVRPPDVQSLDDEVCERAIHEGLSVELPAGGVLAIDGAVVHHSPPNRSSSPRISVICALRPIGATMQFVRSDSGAPRGVAEVYDVGDELYRSGNLMDPDLPSSLLRERVEYRPASSDDLERALAAGRE